MTTIDPELLTRGAEWSLEGGRAPGSAVGGGEGFGSMLGRQIQNLSDLQVEAGEQSRALATGGTQDAAQVVMAVERARLAMQLASTLRTKSVEAINDVMHTTV